MQKKLKLINICALLFLNMLLFHSPVAIAHALEQSYIFLKVTDDAIGGRVEITIADINRALSLQLDTQGGVSQEDIEPYAADIIRYVEERVSIRPESKDRGTGITHVGLSTLPLSQYVVVNFNFPELSGTSAYIDFEYAVLFDKAPEHRGFVVVETNWKTGTFENEALISTIFEPGKQSYRLDLSSSSVFQGIKEMIRLGIHHIWVGIDHILFLLALLLPSVVRRTDKGWVREENFRSALISVIKIVTVFTLAHTLTLSAAAMGSMSLSSRWVESVIALSIAIAALDVLYPIFHRKIWLVIFGFGLFHGFGFASVLSTIGIPSNYLIHSLLAFNVGVEVGQVVIVCMVFSMLYLVSRYAFYVRAVLPCCATALIVVSLYWFVERGFLIDLPAGEYANWMLERLGIRV